MEKRKYFLDYDLNTKKALFIGIARGSENCIELELDESKFLEISNNLDFIFIKNGEPILNENYKTEYLEKLNSKNRIEELKQLLASTDWKVIVNAELIQAGLDPKYPNLHTERQAWRDEINELESL